MTLNDFIDEHVISVEKRKDHQPIDVIAELHNQLDRRLKDGSQYQLQYEALLSRIAKVRLDRAVEYGESRYEEKGREFNLWMIFSDVHRKYIRLRQLTNSVIDGENKSAREALYDTYLDLANYAIMGMQILDLLQERENANKN